MPSLTSPTTLEPSLAPIEWHLTPQDVLRRWPSQRAAAVLWSGRGRGASVEHASPWSRWTIFGIVDEIIEGDDPALLDQLSRSAACSISNRADSNVAHTEEIPFLSGWIVQLSYELGARIEPRARGRRSHAATHPAARTPLIRLRRCPAALVHDGERDRWWLTGDACAARELLREVQSAESTRHPSGAGGEYLLGPLRSRTGRERFERSVARAIEYIHEGDVFQVNLSHVLSGPFRGSSRALFADLAAAAAPWFGAYLELPESQAAGVRIKQTVASISPELFLDYRPADRLVTTRPIKGTRRVGGEGAADPRSAALELQRSEKDHAELAMIVDLMRNDLGRVCEFGSVRVTEARGIERHAAHAEHGRTPESLWHGVATVQGRLRESLGIADLLRATFPGGSITGAPKIRAMQIIDELEDGGAPRGQYTGSIGYVDDRGNAAFNIAIRTAHISEPVSTDSPPGSPGTFSDGTLEYAVGAGIVADSDPAAEWEETLAKAGTILAIQRASQTAAFMPVIRAAPAESIPIAQRP